jgi:hypothetical protein
MKRTDAARMDLKQAGYTPAFVGLSYGGIETWEHKTGAVVRLDTLRDNLYFIGTELYRFDDEHPAEFRKRIAIQ